MRTLTSFSILHASTVCKNSCEECPFVGYEPRIAKLDYMLEILRYLKSRAIFPVLDIAGMDISHNPHVPELLLKCKKMGVITSATIGTPHSIKMAPVIFDHTDEPRISFEGPDFADSYRGEGNYESFVRLMEIARQRRALKKLKVVFTPIPGRNVRKGLLADVIETVRILGDNKAKLLINPINTHGYSKEEWQLLKDFGGQAQAIFSKATQQIHEQKGETKGCLCRAPRHMTFGADETLIAPCGLLPLKKFDLKAGIDTILLSKEWRTVSNQCGKHPACAKCWATCYHLAGVFLRPDWRFLLPHLLSTAPVQNARDAVHTAFGQLRKRENRHPFCPQMREPG